MNNEIWRRIPGYEGWYQVSDQGRVRRLMPAAHTYPGKILKPFKNTDGYLNIKLCRNGNQKSFRIHRLVLAAFEGEDLWHDVNHINGIKTDNRLENLEYVTRSQNQFHAYNIIKVRTQKGEQNGNAKLTEDQVIEICKLLNGGESQVNIARRFGMSHQMVSNIANGLNWTSITDVYLMKGNKQQPQFNFAPLFKAIAMQASCEDWKQRGRPQYEPTDPAEIAAIANACVCGNEHAYCNCPPEVEEWAE